MRKILLFTISLFLATTAMAQTRVIKGKVTAADEPGGFPGVSVLVQGTSKGVSTDFEGNYTLEVAPGENTLVFSFVGYKTQIVDITNRDVADVVLETDATALDEVVVIGYGTVRKSDLTGSVSSVKGSDLTSVPSINPMQSLQGKVPGLQVTSTSGAPGSSPVVRIRGTGTFNESSPIYVVDGVILDNIDFLSSGDIESMELLKDASSTAMYGSRGANGVIMVTTKRGKSGQTAPVISFSAEYSVQKLQKTIDLLNGKDFALYVNEFDPTYNNPDAVPNTDWQNLIFRDAPIQNYQASITGATDKSQYYFGLGYFKQDGIIEKSSYERLTLKFNNTYNLSSKIRLGNNITITPNKQQNTNGNVVFVSYRAWPALNPFDPAAPNPEGLNPKHYTDVPGVGNPLADIEHTNSFDKAIRAVGNIFAEADFLNAFTFRTSFGVDMAYRKNTAFSPRYFVSTAQQNSENDLAKNYSDQLTWLWENTLTYNKQFGKHRINALVGYTMQEASSEYVKTYSENLIREGEDFWYFNPSILNPTFINDPNGVELGLNWAMISYLFRANYTYDNRYLFTATFRRDGSSKFLPQNRYGNFPSLAVGWNVINEGFMSSVEKLSNLKIRASWGIIGNDKIPYDRIYSTVDNGLGAVFGSDILYPGATYGGAGNPDLIWETTYQTDIGLETGFFNDKLTLEADYYHRRTDDILVPLQVPGYLGNGGATITYNAAEVVNKGIEALASWNSEWNGLRYRVSANVTTIKNEVTKILKANGAQGDIFGDDQLTRSRKGSEIGAFYGYKVDGIFQNQGEIDDYPHLSDAEPGDLKYVDVNGDNVIDDKDRTYLGSPIPKVLYGFSAEVGYKGFDLGFDFQGQSGNKIMNFKESVRVGLYNFESHVRNYWNGEGSSNSEPRPTEGGNNYRISSRFVQDGSFLRLRSVTLGYTVPRSLSEKLLIKTARVYVRGTNIFTSTKWTGYTPEIASNSPVNNAIDRGTYPVPSIYSVGVNLTF